VKLPLIQVTTNTDTHAGRSMCGDKRFGGWFCFLRQLKIKWTYYVEQISSSCNASDLYSEGARFDYQRGHLIFWRFHGFFSPSRQMLWPVPLIYLPVHYEFRPRPHPSTSLSCHDSLSSIHSTRKSPSCRQDRSVSFRPVNTLHDTGLRNRYYVHLVDPKV
jgi:hypothetical protein